jgi:uncharacterized protein
LLGIDSPEHLEIHSARGAIFEGFVIGEFLKLQTTAKHKTQCFYWREHSRQEVDLLIEKEMNLGAIEIKSSMTLAEHFQKGLNYLIKTIKDDMSLRPTIIYAGDENLSLGGIPVTRWKFIDDLNLVD